jgi:aryl-alcohol dehydrogenase-like predicted oxidoreductase
MDTPNTLNNRLVLGTVQLGLPYGIANRSGQPDADAALSIVKAAVDGGIVEFDTAQGYGNSEQVLGDCLVRIGCANDVKIVSKLSTPVEECTPSILRESTISTLARLQVPALHGMLLHKEEFLAHWDSGLGDAFHSLVTGGYVNNIGISVYSPETAIRALETDNLTMVQIPSNLFDRRFERAGVFELAKRTGKTLYIRSIFLQGLVFMTPDTVPPAMAFAAPTLEILGALTRRWSLSVHELAMGYARSTYGDTRVLFGAETQKQVTDNIAAWDTRLPDACVEDIRSTFDAVDERVLNPVLWS